MRSSTEKIRRSVANSIMKDPKHLREIRKTFKLMKTYPSKQKMNESHSQNVSRSMQTQESETHIVDCKHEVFELVRSAIDDGADFLHVNKTYGEDSKKGKFEVRFTTPVG